MLKATLKAAKGSTTISQTFDKSPLKFDPEAIPDTAGDQGIYGSNPAKTFLQTWAALLDGAVAVTNNMTNYENYSVEPD